MGGEFDIIAKYFRPLTMGYGGAENLLDDGAVLAVPDGHELVVTSDTLNAGTHFLEDEIPENIARKALRVNLSDLASMGAKPLCYQLNIALPQKPQYAWLKAFSSALLADNERYNVFCSGGDTTSIKGGVLSLSITAMGTVPRGQAVRRTGAKVGDRIVITGVVGDAVLGLKALQDGLDSKVYASAIDRYRLPQPRCDVAEVVRQYAHAAADISDGLLADIVQIAKASGLAAEIDLDSLRFSDAVQGAIERGDMSLQEAVRGGDDYELAMAVPADRAEEFISELKKNGLCALYIGVFNQGDKVVKLKGNDAGCIDLSALGWVHF